MKLSSYNNYITSHDKLIIYNTLSGGVLSLSNVYKESFELIKSKLINNNIYEGITLDLFNNLLKGSMIIEDDIIEFDIIKMQYNINRFSNTDLVLTIAPTLKCNFQCPYCYENGKRNKTMGDKEVDATIKFINKQLIDTKSLSISWYGGEPLLAIDLIEKIYSSIDIPKNNKGTNSIVTNGYYLTRENALRLKKINVTVAQVTIDGPPEIHNKRRIMQNKDTFSTILKNIADVHDLIHISIRVNVDRNNIDSVDSILDYLDSYELKGKVSLYLAPVDAVNDNCNAPNCMNDFEFAKKEVEFAKKHINRGYSYINIPRFRPNICGAVSPNSYVIDAHGDLYKCWDEVGNTKYKYGDVFNEPKINKNVLKWMNYDPIFYPECKECEILPVCMGGCPYKNIETRQRSCHSIKYNQAEVVNIIASLQNQL